MNRVQITFVVYALALFCLFMVEPSYGYNVNDAVSPDSLPLIQNVLGEDNPYAGMDRLMAERWNQYANVFSFQGSRTSPGYGNGINDHLFLNNVEGAAYILNPLFLFNDGGAVCWSEFLSDISDIVYDTDSWPDNPDEGTMAIFRGTALHELGHAIGLGHNFYDMSVMNYDQPDDLSEHLFPDDIKYLMDSFPEAMTHLEDLGIWAFHANGEKTYERATIAPLVSPPGGTVNITGLYIGNMMTETVSGAFVDVYMTPVVVYGSETSGIQPTSMWIETFIVDDMAPATGYMANLMGISLPINMPADAYRTTCVIRHASGIADSIEINNLCELNGFIVVEDPYEGDDSMGQARNVSSGCSEIHNLFPAGDEDWLMFDIDTTSEVQITTENSQLYVPTEIWLYDQSAGLVAHEAGDGDYALLKRILGPGRYYIRVTCDLAYPDTCYHYTLGLHIRRGPEITGQIVRQDNGQGLDNVSLSFSASGGTVTTAGGGYFTNQVAYGWSGTVTPSLSGWQFTPSTYSFSTPVTETPSPLNFTASPQPAKRIVLDRTSVQVAEGRRGWFNVCLSEAPAQNVTVSVVRVSGDSDLSVTNDTRRIFTTSNWKTNQTVQIDAGEDSDESAGVAIFRCSASGWQSADITAVEADNDGGAVQVFILPAEASPAGGQWRVEGGSWHNSGEVDSDVPWAQDFRIEFKDIPGWYAPAPISVLLNAYNPSAIATGVYTMAVAGSGSVRIDVLPPQAAANGAMWRLDSGAWNQSGETIRGVAAGAHTLEFSAVNGYVTAGTQHINLVPDCTFVNSAIYSPDDMSVILSPGDNIQSAITAATNGMHIILNDGNYNLGNNGTLTVTQGIVLRSRNGYAACTLIADTDERCVNINNADAIVDGLSLTSLLDRDVTGDGGAVSIGGGTLANCRVYDSMAEYNGGGIAGNGVIRNCLIEGCWADLDDGGGVYGSGSLYFSTIRNCYADEKGGAIAGTWDVVGCELSGNRAAGSWGGAGVSQGTSAYRDCLIVNNNAYGDGGGIYIGQGTIEGCRITDNFSDGDGGGVYTPGGAGLVISNCLFVRNRSDLGGGGICNDSMSSEGIVHIVDCIVSNNTSENAEGGGIFSANNSVVTGCRVTSNVADDPADVDGRGGGIYIADNATIENCIVSFNRADVEGGGIYAHGNNVRVVGCLLFKNSAAYGGGYYNNYYGNTISDCTVVYNTATAQGGGLFRDSGSPVYRNCIAYFNTAPSDANFNDRSVSAFNCCITPLPGTGSGNIIASPSFVSAGQDNYRLRNDSPCVDTGDISDQNKDLDGVPVPLDGNSSGTSENDIGAYEYVPPSGSVIVRIDPVYAADAGGRWSIGGTNWYASDQRVDYVPAGNRTLSFTNIPGWAQPGPYTVTIVAGSVLATNGVYLPLSSDTDGDELPDEWEISHFDRLTNVNFSSDFDGDRLTEYYEHLAGTDPRDPTSFLVFNEGGIRSIPGQGVSLRWYSGTGVSYRVCRTTNLVNGFQIIAPVVSGTAPMTFYTDPSLAIKSFYRVEKNP